MDNRTNHLLDTFAETIHSENEKYNLTGFKTLDKVRTDLVGESYRDLNLLNVPRGTSFVDMGCGSGVPGVVLAIHFPEYNFTLVDSNSKKIAFINEFVEKKGITNVNAVYARLEEYSREHRSEYDIAISRAFGPLYYSLEFGMTMLKKGGFLYIYSHYQNSNLSDKLNTFAAELGGDASPCPFGLGIYYKKSGNTPEKYPRRFPVIKREAKKIPEAAE